MVRKSLIALVIALMALVGLGVGLWTWSAGNTSLASALVQLTRLLPAGLGLETRDVSGSVREGGHIGWLRWQKDGLSLEAQDVRVRWSLASLLHKHLQLTELTIADLHIDDRRPPTPGAAPTPPSAITLPLEVDASFSVGTVALTGSTSQTLTQLSGHYVFDSMRHRLDKGQVRISSGNYQFSGQLQAQEAMALAVHVSGTVRTKVPGSQQDLTLNAQAELTGALAGADASLALQAHLTPELASPGHARSARQAATQASVSAKLAPWQEQQLSSAQAQWQALDLSALWPQAPQTLLSGEGTVSPVGQGWQAKINLTNALNGPWNTQRLPLQSLNAQLVFVSQRWTLESLQATGAGGSVVASGQHAADLWQGQAQLQGINPAAIDSRLAHSSMSGTLSARQNVKDISFEVNLQAAANGSSSQASSHHPNSLQALRLQQVVAKGAWASPLLSLDDLQITAQDAQLQGQLAYNTNSQATQGKLSLRLPGLQTNVDGKLASTDGKGQLAVHLTDALLATRWLARWPDVASALNGASLSGAADLSAQWQGGWQKDAKTMQLAASLRATALDWHPAEPGQTTATGWRLRDLQTDASGTLGALTLQTRGLLETGGQKMDWQGQARLGRLSADAWQASISQFKAAWHNSGTPKGPWSIQWGDTADKPVTLDWLQAGLQRSLRISAGTAHVQGPAPGAVTVSWQPARWAAAGPKGPAQWQSQGAISKVPLAWLEVLGGKTLAELGLSSDLVLSGNWDASQTDALHLRATLERSAGDLRLRVDEGQSKALPAGLREAWMQLNLDGRQLSGSLRWDSERLGKALLAFSTQAQTSTDNWGWNNDAPVGGSLQMKLPPVDAWSVLAPPGWRLRGTVNADIGLTGTLGAPEWTGTLQARDLAVRSVVDGVDFSQGTLDARLQGQQLDIQSFKLQGAGGAAGGQLAMTGSANWLPGSSSSPLNTRVRMLLVAEAKALRLSSRPDRRMVVSGKISTELNEARLSLRGKLTADQALITLPEDAAPVLGDDVLVRRPAASRATATQTDAPANGSTKTSKSIKPDVLIELDLGPDFQVRGRGLESRLAGKLTLSAKDSAAPSLTGTVRTVRGTYKAYGQRLDIEQGVVRFVGPIDNPSLTILAIRPKLTQRVGVQISGSALSPIVRLYAEPDLPDAEKLAWLVLGRSPDGGGAEAALMQQAALALLGSNGKNLSASLTQALGLDELSFRGNANSNGTDSAASVTLGKRLSSDFYVAYESSLNGAMGVFSIFYDLTRHLTLRAQTGEQSAVDLIYTLRYD